MAKCFQMIQEEYGVKKKIISKRNPQVNAIVERVHQIIGNMLRTFEVQETELDESDPWAGILKTTTFEGRDTIHTTTKTAPIQLVHV